MNLDFGGAYTDRKELHEAARKAMEAKVRTDLRAEYDSKIKQAAMKVLAAKPIKRQTETGEIWTAPVLVTIEDRDSRWQVEDMLRKSKVFPSFHWPREMVDNVKAYRQVINKLEFTDDEYFVRIRPDQRDGVWRIKADAKSKVDDGYGKFFPVAAFDLPPPLMPSFAACVTAGLSQYGCRGLLPAQQLKRLTPWTPPLLRKTLL
jgi:hypothetical protein